LSPALYQPYRWTSATGMVSLGDLPGGGTNGAAYGISGDANVIVGNSQASAGFEAFRWTSAGGMASLGGINSAAYGASYDGSVIVGTTQGPTGGAEAFRWTSATGMVGLGDLAGGLINSNGAAVSADGTIVFGWGNTSIGNEAFIWDAANGMRNLRTLLINDYGLNLTGWILSTGTGMSADGRVFTGEGINPAGQTEAWIADIRPAEVPEPSSLILAFTALGAIGVRRCGRQRRLGANDRTSAGPL